MVNYTEYRNITGNTKTTIFPNVYDLDNSSFTFNNTQIKMNAELITNDMHLGTLTICPLATTGGATYISFNLFMSRKIESEEGVITTTDYAIAKSTVIPLYSTLVFEKEDLNIFDPTMFDLKVQFNGATDSADIFYTIKNMKQIKPLKQRNTSAQERNLIERRESLVDRYKTVESSKVEEVDGKGT